jgi:replicative DNA helicase
MNLDLALCKKILDDGLEAIGDRGVTVEFFVGDGKKAFQFIYDHFKQYGQMPDVATIKQDVGVVLPDPPEPIEFYIDKVAERRMGHVFGDHLKDAIGHIRGGHPDKVADVARKIVSISNAFSTGRRAFEDLRETAKARWEAYQDVAANFGQIDGIVTPWKELDEVTLGMHGGELWVLVARLKTGKCLREGTPVLDPDSGQWIPIESIISRKGDVVTFDSGSVRPACPSKYWNNGIKECLRLKTRLGNMLDATVDEPMLTPSGWRPLNELAPTDKIACVARIPEPRHTISMPDAELVVLACLIAEGCTRHRKGDVKFSNGDSELVEQMAKAVRSLGCSLHKRQKYEYDIVSDQKQNKVKTLVVQWGLEGKLAKDKRIPGAVFSLTNGQLAKFLGILWSCDGSIENRRGELSYSSASEGLIDDVRRLLSRFGIVSRKRVKHPKRGGKIFTAWELSVRSQSRDFFEAHILRHMIKRKIDVFTANKWRGRKANDDAVRATEDIIDKINEALTSSGHTWSEFWEHYGWASSSGIRGLVNPKTGLIPRERLRAFVEFTGAQELSWIVSEEIAWDEVESTEAIGAHQTYDLTIPDTHCFVASNMVVHNSWGLTLFMERAWKAGHKPLLVSMEMPINKMSRRFDALHTCLPYQDFRAGTLGSYLEKVYMESLSDMQTRHEIWIAGNGRVRSPADIDVLVQELKPSVVFIDGLYLMVPSHGRFASKYERVSMVIDELQPLAHKLDIPIMASTQFNRSLKKGKVQGATESIGFAYEIGQNADVLIGMFSDDDLKASRRMLLTLMEHREGEDVNMLCRWDLEAMDFSFIGYISAEELEEMQGGSSASKAAAKIKF